MGWPTDKIRLEGTATPSHRYLPHVWCCAALLPLRDRKDFKEVFGLYKSQLSEMFREGLMVFVSKRLVIIMGDLQGTFYNICYENYAAAVHRKSHAWGT